MPLIGIVSQMGTLGFASRSGEHGYLSKIPISDESEHYFQSYPRSKAVAAWPETRRSGCQRPQPADRIVGTHDVQVVTRCYGWA
jgi:hypothetical protein